jgi:hypothetical protein
MKALSAIVAAAAVAALALPIGAAPPPGKQVTQLRKQVVALRTKVQALTRANESLRIENAQLRTRIGELSADSNGLRGRLGLATCAVTTPNGSAPPGERPSDGHHGNGAIWTGFPSYGVIVVPKANADGTLRMKFPWWFSVDGSLSIEGRRLDMPAPPLGSQIPSGYNQGFQASALLFPTEGCWEVTGRVGSAALTFVVFVVKALRDP